jgi:type IV secretory pathway VirB10-like protein
MMSRSIAVGLLAAATVTAAAAGSYVAVRQNRSEPVAAQPAAAPLIPAGTPITAETEGVVLPAEPSEAPPSRREPAAVEPVVVEPSKPEPRRTRRPTVPGTRADRAGTISTAARQPATVPAAERTPADELLSATPAAAEPPPQPEIRAMDAETERTGTPEFEELVVPASAVIGLEIERTVTSEQAKPEDRVDARVTRDVYADSRLAIPSGSRVIGNVTVVERGGKMKDRARLGVRFHTLVLADGRQVPLRTETVFREGDSPGAESSRKIVGAAIGGAVLGAILGGGKGAVTGAAAGAAGGTAVVMAGGRNAATLQSGTVVTVPLSAPVTIDVAR